MDLLMKLFGKQLTENELELAKNNEEIDTQNWFTRTFNRSYTSISYSQQENLETELSGTYENGIVRRISTVEHQKTPDISHGWDRVHEGYYETKIQLDSFTKDGRLVERRTFHSGWGETGFSSSKVVTKSYRPGHFDWNKKLVKKSPFC